MAEFSPLGFKYITPDDDKDLDPRPRRLYIGLTGDLALRNNAGDSIIFQNVAVGFVDISPDRVLATGTTASQIIGLY